MDKEQKNEFHKFLMTRYHRVDFYGAYVDANDTDGEYETYESTGYCLRKIESEPFKVVWSFISVSGSYEQIFAEFTLRFKMKEDKYFVITVYLTYDIKDEDSLLLFGDVSKMTYTDKCNLANRFSKYLKPIADDTFRHMLLSNRPQALAVLDEL
jgi:hypothetical protein